MNKNIYLIAEIGINHNGDLEIAKELIKRSKEAGFDAVKFQKRDLDSVYSKDYLESFRESPWGKTQRDQKKALEFEKEEYDEINSYCSDLDIDWSASAWDLKSQKFLQNYDLNFNKIASPMLTNIKLLELVSLERKKTFISTGMSTLEEIDRAVEIFKNNECAFELMHCNSTYPMKEEDANLLCIKMLKKRYNCQVGYSGHESSLLKVCISAVALGATSIERHITLDRAMYGSDQAASIEVDALSNFCKTIKKIPQIIGDGKKIISEEEKAIKEKLRSLS
jgi:N-acetylneuraminate synthase